MSEEIEVVGHLLPSWFFDGDTTVLEDADIYVSDDLADLPIICSMKGCHQIELMTVYQHNRIIEQYKRDAGRMREALDEIVMPIKYMQQRLEDGCQLNGMAAIQMANDPEYLRQIAKQALSAQPDHSADKLTMVKPAITSVAQLVDLLNGVRGLHDQCVEFTAADVWAQLVKQQPKVRPDPACGHRACKALGEPHPLCRLVSAQQAEVKP